jgi:hypothetical protein
MMVAMISQQSIAPTTVLTWMERVMGIEPTLVAWEATVLPLNYTRSPREV